MINNVRSNHVDSTPKSAPVNVTKTMREKDPKQYGILRAARKLRFTTRRLALRELHHKPGAKAIRCKLCGFEKEEALRGPCPKKKS